MNSIRTIETDVDYQDALSEIDSLIDSDPGTEAEERLALISILVADYEDKHHSIGLPDPISFLEYVMESRCLTRRDLEPYIGSRARVAEVLNRRRGLSIEMVRNLCNGLDLPSDVLIQPYKLVPANAGTKNVPFTARS